MIIGQLEIYYFNYQIIIFSNYLIIVIKLVSDIAF